MAGIIGVSRKTFMHRLVIAALMFAVSVVPVPAFAAEYAADTVRATENGGELRVSSGVAHTIYSDGTSVHEPLSSGERRSGGSERAVSFAGVGGRAHGTVRDRAGKPLAGIRVMPWLARLNDYGLYCWTAISPVPGAPFTAETAADGSYDIPALELADRYALLFYDPTGDHAFWLSGACDPNRTGSDWFDCPEGSTVRVDAVLVPGAAISGHVSTSGGAKLPLAPVSFTAIDPSGRMSGFMFSGLSMFDGDYSYRGVPASLSWTSYCEGTTFYSPGFFGYRHLPESWNDRHWTATFDGFGRLAWFTPSRGDAFTVSTAQTRTIDYIMEPMTPSPGESARPVVVLIGGIMSSCPGPLWTKTAEFLDAAGYDVVQAKMDRYPTDDTTIDSDGFYGPPAARVLDRFLRTYEGGRLVGRRVVFVGHSMGGLIARSYGWLSEQDDEESCVEPAGIIQLGTPNLGSPAALLTLIIDDDSGTPTAAESLLSGSRWIDYQNAACRNASSIPIFRLGGNAFPSIADRVSQTHPFGDTRVMEVAWVRATRAAFSTEKSDGVVSELSVLGGPGAGWAGYWAYELKHVEVGQATSVFADIGDIAPRSDTPEELRVLRRIRDSVNEVTAGIRLSPAAHSYAATFAVPRSSEMGTLSSRLSTAGPVTARIVRTDQGRLARIEIDVPLRADAPCEMTVSATLSDASGTLLAQPLEHLSVAAGQSRVATLRVSAQDLARTLETPSELRVTDLAFLDETAELPMPFVAAGVQCMTEWVDPALLDASLIEAALVGHNPSHARSNTVAGEIRSTAGSVSYASLSFDGGATWTSVEPSDGAFDEAEEAFSATYELGPGWYGITVVAGIGDEPSREITASAAFLVDGLEPLIEVEASENGTEAGTFTVSASDMPAGVAEIDYRLDDESTRTIAGDAAVLTVSTVGSHTIRVRARDNAGNASHTVSGWLTVWAQPSVRATPAQSIVTYGGSTFVTAKVTALGKPVEDSAVYLQRFDGSRWADVYEWGSVTRSTGTATLPTPALTETATFRVRVANSAPLLEAFSAPFAIAPKVILGTPRASSTTRRSVPIAVSGTLKPAHDPGSTPVCLYLYRKVSKTRWRSYGWVPASVGEGSAETRYSARVRLTARGTWRIKAVHPVDVIHAETSSGYRYVTVR